MLDLNDIVITKGVITTRAGDVVSDLSTINVDVAPKYVLFSPNKSPDLLRVIALRCAAFAKLTGATFLFHHDEELGYDKMHYAKIYTMLNLMGFVYTTVTTKDLPYKSDKLVGEYYTDDAGYQHWFTDDIGSISERFRLSKIAYNYPGTLLITSSESNFTYLHEQGMKVLAISSRIDDQRINHKNILHHITSTTASQFEGVTSKKDYDDINEFEDKNLNIVIAKSAKEMTFEYVTDAIYYANTNDSCLLFKKLGFKW